MLLRILLLIRSRPPTLPELISIRLIWKAGTSYCGTSLIISKENVPATSDSSTLLLFIPDRCSNKAPLSFEELPLFPALSNRKFLNSFLQRSRSSSNGSYFLVL